MRSFLLIVAGISKTLAVVVWLVGGSVWLGLALFFLPGFVILYHLLTPGAQGLCRVVTRFATDRKEVWLTFDDGPDNDDTPRALASLARHGAHATFFLVGTRAAQWPEWVDAIVAQGHEVGHHSHTHPVLTFWSASPRRLHRELDDATAVFAGLGQRPTRFRAPAGLKNLWLEPALRARRLTLIGWSVRSWDSVRPTPGPVVSEIMRRVRPGAIILLHEGLRAHPRVQLETVDLLLSALHDAGYTCIIPTAAQLR